MLYDVLVYGGEDAISPEGEINEGLLYCIVLCCAVMHCTVLYCALLYCAVLCVLYCIVLYCIALHCIFISAASNSSMWVRKSK